MSYIIIDHVIYIVAIGTMHILLECNCYVSFYKVANHTNFLVNLEIIEGAVIKLAFHVVTGMSLIFFPWTAWGDVSMEGSGRELAVLCDGED